jgi:hypothetical protein
VQKNEAFKIFYPVEWAKVDEQARKKALGLFTIVGLILSLVAFLVLGTIIFNR